LSLLPVLIGYDNKKTFVFNIVRNDVIESDYHFPVSLETNFSFKQK